ncbi:arginase family protein [Streptomyces sp. NPDC051776]|uniref:arginase family protein n=1 Tax=Streptomyces sp. NPDC051776 TaxID=3155414 RepID=UPI003412E1DD
MTASSEVVLVGVPLHCVGMPEPGDPPTGTERAPAALRAAGLADAVAAAADLGDLDVRLTGPDRDADTGVQGWPSVCAATEKLRARIAEIIGADRVPLVLGGDCTLLPGALAGAHDALGNVGLAYVDGHLDLYDGRTSTTGEPADMPLAVVTGHGPPAWCEVVGAPLVSPGRLALLGPRDREEAAGLGAAMPEDIGLRAEADPEDLRARGIPGAGAEARDQLSVGASGRYWVHLDVDVLDEAAFPATDYPVPDGLTLGELQSLLRPLTADPGLLAGLSVGCYNPDKDPDGSGAEELVALLGELLRYP